jgi:hypothetical protein
MAAPAAVPAASKTNALAALRRMVGARRLFMVSSLFVVGALAARR